MTSGKTFVEKPSVLNTVISLSTNNDVDYEKLHSLKTYNEKFQRSKTMKYGQIISMINWIRNLDDGCEPPRKFYIFYRYDAGGRCIVCGHSVSDRWPGPISKKDKIINEGGYCEKHGIRKSDYNDWVAIANYWWHKIKQNRITKKTWWKTIWWEFFWWTRLFPERFIDTRFMIEYTTFDENTEHDRSPANLKIQAKKLCLILYEMIDKM